MVRTATETPARLPDDSGYVERDGVRVWWEAYGSGDLAILLMPKAAEDKIAALEGADPLPGAALPGRDPRWPRQRVFGPAGGLTLGLRGR